MQSWLTISSAVEGAFSLSAVQPPNSDQRDQCHNAVADLSSIDGVVVSLSANITSTVRPIVDSRRIRRGKELHERICDDHAIELAEDYVEAIADLIESEGACRLIDLAAHFGVTHVTANRIVGRLQRDGLVTTEPYAPIELTTEGIRLAKASRRRHEIVYQFLLALGVQEKTAAADSEGIEHHVGPETLRKKQQFVKQATGVGPEN